MTAIDNRFGRTRTEASSALTARAFSLVTPSSVQWADHRAAKTEAHFGQETFWNGFRLQTLLALVTRCYASGIYGSRKIAAAGRRDAQFVGTSPDTQIVRRFRIEQRNSVHVCLTKALRYLAEQKLESGAVTRIHPAQLAEESNRRLVAAAFEDSVELDSKSAGSMAVELPYLVARERERVH